MTDKEAGHIQSSVEGFLASLERCTKKKGFFDVFYQHFVTANPEIQAFFADTDMRAQSHMLEKSLRLAAVAIVGSAVGVAELEKRAISHDVHHMNIDPSLYAYWLDALLQSVADRDPQWSGEVEQRWRTVLSHIVETMAKGYDRSLSQQLAG